MLEVEGLDAGAGLSRRIASRRAAARCSASTASWAAASSSWRARCSASCGPIAGALRIERASRRTSPIRPPRASAPASPMSPESRRAMLFREEPIYKNVSIAILERISRWWLQARQASGASPTTQVKALRHPPARVEARLGALVRRQSAEGGARQMADPRRRKVLVLGEPTRGMDVGAKEDVVRIVQALRDQGIGDRRAVDRAGDDAVARRPRPGDEEGRGRAANSPTARSARTPAGGRMTGTKGHGSRRQPTPPAPPAPRLRPRFAARSVAQYRAVRRRCSSSSSSSASPARRSRRSTISGTSCRRCRSPAIIAVGLTFVILTAEIDSRVAAIANATASWWPSSRCSPTT